MHILICTERLLFRFGADRALIILAKGLKKIGHKITVMTNAYDEATVAAFADKIIKVPYATDYYNANEFTAEWIKQNWSAHFDEAAKPNIVLLSGWPFFSSIPELKKLAGNVIFFDCGAVPIDGYTGGSLEVQKKLRELRATYLKECTLIISISKFIAESQSRIDSLGQVPIETVLLGADHMNDPTWMADKEHSGSINSENTSKKLIKTLKKQGRKIILYPGRFESGCYKNSEAVFEFMEILIKTKPNTALLILADDKIQIPRSLKNYIFPIGFPDDEQLCLLMKQSAFGISPSKWEGFNLPLAEMQCLNRQFLVLNVGAHPEVVAHPWYLCDDIKEMAQKADMILSDKGPDDKEKSWAYENFRTRFLWQNTIDSVNQILSSIMNSVPNETTATYSKMRIIIDVTNSTRDPANSGVIRHTRRLCKELQDFVDVVFVVWNNAAGAYFLPTESEFSQLSAFNGPQKKENMLFSLEVKKVELSELLNDETITNWLIFAETMEENKTQDIRKYAKKMHLKIAAIFYDAIAVMFPELCSKEVSANHGKYMNGLAECEVVIPISDFSAQCLKDFWKKAGLSGFSIETNVLPGEFGGHPRVHEMKVEHKGPTKVLCVSTLEPRKNHFNLIEALSILEQKHPNLDWQLTLVGNKYAGAMDIADKIQAICERNKRIKWLGIVDDDKLHELYLESTFTIYPSIVEGFGFPIMESLWHGKPCICFNEGVMASSAQEGGCLTTNVKDPATLANAIHQLITNKELYEKLVLEAASRPIKSWKDYVQKFLNILESQRIEGTKDPSWQKALYPNCLCENWQMNDSERLAIASILSRIKPRCSIEVGTYMGGSLSLISQYSKHVFSIDIDPEIPQRYKQFQNVSFLTGPSDTILPLLFAQLDCENIPVDFILIDGDHSAEGIRKDLNCIFSYTPKKPLYVMMHDSFNSECRRGMLEADWEKSPYIQWADLDFIPGRIIEHLGGGHGEMWGGLGLIHLSPEKGNGKLNLRTSAQLMFTKIKNSIELVKQ